MNERDVGSWARLHNQRLSRRGLMCGAGFAMGASLLSPRLANARDSEARRADSALTKPIPGGVAPVAPFGVRIHHNPLNPALPIASLNDPSQISDFEGFVGLTHIRGGGTGTNTVTNAITSLAFQADMGFSKGKFIGVDGHQHEGTFAFVWLDVFTGPVGSASLPQQIHDYNVHIDSNDVFWMVAVDDDAVKVDFDGARARLVVNDLEVYDDHDLANSLTLGLGLPGLLGSPLIPGVAPVRAKVSFDIEWNGVVASAMIHNAAQQFEGTFLSTGATIKWSAEQPGFQFDSEDPNPSRNLISVLGDEKNGVFFT